MVSKKKSDIERQKLNGKRRDKKREDFEELYEKEKEFWIESGLNLRYELPAKEEYVANKLREWDDQQLKVPAGKYQNKKKIDSICRQRFVEYICQLCPNVIDELREYVPVFNRLLGENKNKYSSVLDWRKSPLFLLDNLLNTHINSLIGTYVYVEFRPERYKNYRDDYQWGEMQLLLHFLELLFVPVDEVKSAEILRDLTQQVQGNLVPDRNHSRFPKDIDEVALRLLVENECSTVLLEFFAGREYNFASEARKLLSEFLKDISSEADITAFVELQLGLLNWAAKHNLEKDWLLHYAYNFLFQLSKNPALRVSDIVIGQQEVRLLEAFPFEFKFDGWISDDERREDYEKRLRDKFEENLTLYFHRVSNQLDLEEQRKTTRPTDYNLVKSLVRKTVQKWSFEKIVELDFGILDTISTKKKFDRKVKYLKEEFPKLEGVGLPYES